MDTEKNMDTDQNLIWILDNDRESVKQYQQILGHHYQVSAFKSMSAISEALSQTAPEEPSLVIIDPENTKITMSDFAGKAGLAGGALKLPEYIIVTRLDDLGLMRFHLKTGARDYLLKPIRPSELVAKIERAVNQISNREVLILRNDLDGIQVPGLTFREHQILTIFLSRPDRTIKREDLFAALWSKVTVSKKTLDVHLFNVRRKIRPLGYDIVCRCNIFSLLRL